MYTLMFYVCLFRHIHAITISIYVSILSIVQGPTWHGKSGVHTHMTNTRITDPEIFERRYLNLFTYEHIATYECTYTCVS